MSLPEWRKEIDRIDAEVLELLNRRAGLAQQIGQAKSTTRSHYFTPEREHIVFKRLATLNKGPLETSSLRAIYKEIISACRALEKPLTVAFLGPEGTFSHLASLAKFGSSSHFAPQTSIAEVFAQVERSACDYGIVPVENSWAGVVPETLDTFMNSNLRVVSEVYQPILHKSADSLRKSGKRQTSLLAFPAPRPMPAVAADAPAPRRGDRGVQYLQSRRTGCPGPGERGDRHQSRRRKVCDANSLRTH